jgi:pimeloyl-ACP methyl ester carboxylesterase
MKTTYSDKASCNGVKIHYETFGKPENPPILLIMGLGAQCIMFTDEFIEPLVDANYYVVRFDNRDIGLSTWMNGSWQEDKPYSLTDMAKDTLELLDVLKITKTHVIGVSMGGMIAQEFTLAYPERVLTLTSIMSTGDTLSPAAGSLMQLPTENALTSDKKRVDNYVDIYSRLAGTRFPYNKAQFKKLFTNAIVKRKGQNPQATIHQLCAIAASGSRLGKLAGIRVPTLILHGTEDPLIPPIHAKTYAPLIPDAKLEWMVGVGHELPNGILPQVHTELFALFKR